MKDKSFDYLDNGGITVILLANNLFLKKSREIIISRLPLGSTDHSVHGCLQNNVTISVSRGLILGDGLYK